MIASSDENNLDEIMQMTIADFFNQFTDIVVSSKNGDDIDALLISNCREITDKYQDIEYESEFENEDEEDEGASL